MLEFIVPAIARPQPRQRHRIHSKIGGKPFVMNYTPAGATVNDFKAAVRLTVREIFDGPPMTGPLCMEVTFVLPRPKGLIWKTRPMPRLWHSKKPDLDNTVKALQDALCGICFVDDSQVCDEHLRKVIAAGNEKPHVKVKIYELSGEEAAFTIDEQPPSF